MGVGRGAGRGVVGGEVKGGRHFSGWRSGAWMLLMGVGEDWESVVGESGWF